MADFGGGEGGRSPIQTVDKKLFAPEGGRIALSANERIAEFLDFVLQAKFAYVNELRQAQLAFCLLFFNGKCCSNRCKVKKAFGHPSCSTGRTRRKVVP